MKIGPFIDPDSNSAAIPPEVDNLEEHKKRVPLIWIAVTIGIGLLIAATYLGSRIFTSRLHVRNTALAVRKPVQVFQKTDLKPSFPVLPQRFADPLRVIAPHAGEQYIQVGALNQESARRFMQRLRAEKMEPHLAPGPNPQLNRILIGPLIDRNALTQQKTQLQALGIDSFVRKY